MKWVALYLLAGIVWQLGCVIYGRWRYGARAMEVTMGTMGPWYVWVISTFTWPFGIAFAVIPVAWLEKHSLAFREGSAKASEAIDEDLKTRCPRCGERWLNHGDEHCS
jgi:hypothetical protein